MHSEPPHHLGQQQSPNFQYLEQLALRERADRRTFVRNDFNQIFSLDDPAAGGNVNLVDAVNEANGVGGNGTVNLLPWGWGTFNPGRTGVTNP